MAKLPLRDKEMDKQAYAHATRQFQLVQEVLPPQAVAKLAHEVVRRLTSRLPRDPDAIALPSDEQIDHLCAALLSAEDDAGDRIIMDAYRAGASARTIYLGYVASAARQLGTFWVEDKVTFAEVTVASSRLYRIIRGLRHVIEGVTPEKGVDRHVLFALVPGDVHTLGIQMASDLFRREGWDVEMSVAEDHDQIIARTELERFQSVVVVGHSEHTLPNLISLVLAVRITQPMAHIVVAGNIVSFHDDIVDLVGADDVIDDIETAVEKLRTIVAPAS